MGTAIDRGGKASGWLDEAREPRGLRQLARRVNGMLTAIVLPPLVLAGMLVLAFNHSSAFRDFVAPPPFDPATIANAPEIEGIDVQTAMLLAAQIWPDEAAQPMTAIRFHGLPAVAAETALGSVVLTTRSGHYAVIRPYSERVYAPNGAEIHSRTDWIKAIRSLYQTTGLNRAAAGTLADLTGLALLVFGLSGLVLWWMPRAVRLKRRIGGGKVT